MTSTASRQQLSLGHWQSRATNSLRATAADLGRGGRVDLVDVGLRLVRPVQSRAKRAPFVVVVLTVLAAGLVGLILISTTLQNLSFQQSEVNRELTVLRNDRDALRQQVDRLASPASIANKADELGMVNNTNPAFLRLSDNEVLGKPEPAGGNN